MNALDLDRMYGTALDYVYVVVMGVAAVCILAAWLWGKR